MRYYLIITYKRKIPIYGINTFITAQIKSLSTQISTTIKHLKLYFTAIELIQTRLIFISCYLV